jgi:NADH-quinone oxidoreductase subunit I
MMRQVANLPHDEPMKPDDPNIKWIEEPKLGLAGKMYLPLVAGGLTTTWKHLTKSLRGETVTVSYPEEEPKIGNLCAGCSLVSLRSDGAPSFPEP